MSGPHYMSVPNRRVTGRDNPRSLIPMIDEDEMKEEGVARVL